MLMPLWTVHYEGKNKFIIFLTLYFYCLLIHIPKKCWCTSVIAFLSVFRRMHILFFFFSSVDKMVDYLLVEDVSRRMPQRGVAYILGIFFINIHRLTWIFKSKIRVSKSLHHVSGDACIYSCYIGDNASTRDAKLCHQQVKSPIQTCYTILY